MMTLSIKIKLLTYVVLVLTTFVNIVIDQYLRISLTLYDSIKIVLIWIFYKILYLHTSIKCSIFKHLSIFLWNSDCQFTYFVHHIKIFICLYNSTSIYIACRHTQELWYTCHKQLKQQQNERSQGLFSYSKHNWKKKDTLLFYGGKHISRNHIISNIYSNPNKYKKNHCMTKSTWAENIG